MVFSKSQAALVVLSVLASSQQAFARMKWLERDDRPVVLNPRRFGQEHPAVIDKIGAACPGQVCGVLSGQAITPLLAAQPECSQQDMADAIIDAAQQFDDTTKANLIALAVEYRQVEKNTPPDFTTNPPTNRNSVFCQKAPKNAELNGLVQAQDPANDPNVFFDPATKQSVQKGAQPNTFPFGTAGSDDSDATGSASSAAATSTSSSAAAATSSAVLIATDSATSDAASATSSSDCETVVTVTVTSSATDAASATASSSAAAASSTAAAGDIGNFGSCSVPQITFAVGLDNRKETAFEPTDLKSFNHGSAQNIDIITQFICDTLTNSCKADQTAKDTCAKAKAAADTGAPKTGVQADLFNAVFGITTNFADVTAIDDQGNPIAGTGSSAASGSSTATTSSAVAAASSTAAAGGIGNFGSCSVPQITFAVGLDNRKETAFEPTDLKSFNHGSAQNIDIITQFICDTLTNSCKADQTAKDTCAKAKAAADTGAPKTGVQADLFNAVFGITTNFAAVTAIDDQGNPIAGTGSSGNQAAATGGSGATASSSAAAASSTAAAGGIGNFGSCSVPQITFAVGLDGRKETAFEPTDLKSFNHGSAQNIDIITQFICDTLTNSCKADQTAKDTCAKAKAAADTGAPKTGVQADLFNAVFGITTNFANTPAVDDQGNVIAGSTGSGSVAASSTAAAASTTAAATTTSSSAAAATTTAAAASGQNLQKFTGNLGGVTPPAVTKLSNGQFQVDGNSAFQNLTNALVRSCDVQHNKCANAANASGNKGDLTVSACGDQQTQCNAAAQQQ
ncbi:hypothetical protein BD310DRAFT_979504 [Dichomitus squalens]|uniref:Uncharacterized protein n=1 Tax=Dichomitus squalens TaxID=114155 RepID=A0A4V2K7C0_9APHY|nr:hypothetical protein BD310DRAFT_979504 [Dichomitus squalens]